MVWAVVPVKPYGQTKSRLSSLLPVTLRTTLFEAMLRDVLTALSECASIEHILLVTSRQRGAVFASEFCAELLEDDGQGGLNGACLKATRYLMERQADTLCLLHGDLPLISPAHIDHLLQIHRPAPGLTLVPNSTETGTNALIASPPDLIPFHYGKHSFQKHLQAAEVAGVSAQIVHIPEIALDIDEPADLKALIGKVATDSHACILLDQVDWTKS